MDTQQGSADTKLSQMIILEEGLRRRLYLKEVTGRGPGPRRRDGAVMNSTAHQGGRAAATDDNNLKPNLPPL